MAYTAFMSRSFNLGSDLLSQLRKSQITL